MPAPYAFNGRAGTRLALLRIGTGGRVASHLGTWSDQQLKNFFFSTEEISHHLEQADTVLREKADLLLVLEREQKKIAADIDNLHSLYQAGQIDKYGFGAKYHPWAERQRQLDDEIPKVQAELDVLKIAQLSQEEIISEARDLYTRWPTLPAEEKRQIVETITERIVIGDGDVEIHLYYAPAGAPPTTGTTGGTPPPSTSLDGGGLATKLHGFVEARNENDVGSARSWRIGQLNWMASAKRQRVFPTLSYLWSRARLATECPQRCELIRPSCSNASRWAVSHSSGMTQPARITSTIVCPLSGVPLRERGHGGGSKERRRDRRIHQRRAAGRPRAGVSHGPDRTAFNARRNRLQLDPAARDPARGMSRRIRALAPRRAAHCAPAVQSVGGALSGARAR